MPFNFLCLCPHYQAEFNLVVILRCCLQRTARKCTKIYNARAEPLFYSLNLLFSDVSVDVAIVVKFPKE